jgi:hypothetical protein
MELFVNAFSMRKNLSKLLETNTDSKQLSCIHGIRFLSVSWIILGHSMLWSNYQIYSKSLLIFIYIFIRKKTNPFNKLTNTNSKNLL